MTRSFFYGFRDPAFDSRTPRPWEQLDTTPPISLSSGCQISCRSTSGLREDSSSAVSPRAGLRHHHHRNLCQMTSLRQELEKKPEKPFMMYVAFDDLQVSTSSCQKCKISSATFFWKPKSVSQLFQFQGPLQVEEKWRDLYPYQVVLMCHQVVSGGIGWCQVVPLGGVRWCHQVILRCH